MQGIYGHDGNQKLGRQVSITSRQAGTTCPGASTECKTFCYAKKGMFLRFGLQKKYGESTINIPKKIRPMFRFNVSGDFDTIESIDWAVDLVNKYPNTKFWAYTRSWNTPLKDKLEELRALPNMQLFASVDATMPTPPKNWRIAYVETDARFTGMECLEQNGKMPDCQSCGYCFNKPKGNVKFKMH